MKNGVLILCLVVVMLASAVSASSCIPYKYRCDINKPQGCCSNYCRNSKCINYGDDDNDRGPNPCRSLGCDPGEYCVLKQVVCVQFPCKPVAECVARS